MSKSTTTIANVYPVARAFSFSEPVEDFATTSISGTIYAATVFTKDDLRVTFYTTDGVVDEVSIVRGETFCCTSMDDAVQVGLRALAGVDVINA